MSCVRRLALAAILLTVAGGASAQAPSPATIARDLNFYAMIVAGYEIDGHCQILAKSQRAEYANHVKVIEAAFRAIGIEAPMFDEIAVKARTVAGSDSNRACDAGAAKTVERLGALTREMGTSMAEWLSKNVPPKPQ